LSLSSNLKFATKELVFNIFPYWFFSATFYLFENAFFIRLEIARNLTITLAPSITFDRLILSKRYCVNEAKNQKIRKAMKFGKNLNLA
jgi:hypothetical protein